MICRSLACQALYRLICCTVLISSVQSITIYFYRAIVMRDSSGPEYNSTPSITCPYILTDIHTTAPSKSVPGPFPHLILSPGRLCPRRWIIVIPRPAAMHPIQHGMACPGRPVRVGGRKQVMFRDGIAAKRSNHSVCRPRASIGD